MTKPTILLVDDDADLLQVIGKRCREMGFNVQQARNLLTATSVLERQVPDVVCVDVEMPTGNGLRFCETISADPRTARVPIIVLTGRRDAGTVDACRRIDAHYQLKSGDTWADLKPLLESLMPRLPSEAASGSTGIRPRNLPTPAIPPLPAEPAAQPNSRRARRQIVIADDDNDLVQLLAQRFSTLGCSVIGAGDSLEAANAIHRMLPDLVVLDVNMPSGSGLSVCEMMATDKRLRRIPVIVLTGQSDEKTIRRCHDMLVFYVQKGKDVWRRIEPLVGELLHLAEEPVPAEVRPVVQTSVATAAVAQTSAPAAPSAQTVVADVAAGFSSAPPVGARQDTLMDAVFAMLGADENARTEEPASDDDRTGETTTSDVPWVLCIDDDSDFADALKTRLEQHGVAVARAANGMEGYRLAFASPASAILLDYNMPNGQGDYILSRLKDNPVTRDIPVFMITGAKDKMLERRVMAMGAAGYFDKPVDFATLRRELAHFIDILTKPAGKMLAAARK